MVKPNRWLKAVLAISGPLLVVASSGCSQSTNDQQIAASGDLYRTYLNNPDAFFAVGAALENEEMLRCMRASGFDVAPRPEEADLSVGSEINSIEEVQTWGLGISTRLYSSNVVDEPAIGHEGGIGAAAKIKTPEVDGEEAGAAFFEAEERCEMNTEQTLRDTFPDEFRVLTAYEEVSADPAYQALQQEIQEQVLTCMKSKGHPYSETFNWDDDFLTRSEQFDVSVSEIYDSERVPSGADLDWRTARAFSYTGGSLSPAQNEQLAEIQDEEQRVALDLADCGYFPWKPSAQTAPLFDNLVDFVSDS